MLGSLGTETESGAKLLIFSLKSQLRTEKQNYDHPQPTVRHLLGQTAICVASSYLFNIIRLLNPSSISYQVRGLSVEINLNEKDHKLV